MWMATVRGVDSVSNSPCVANSNFTSSTGSLVVCALSRCSLDARFWNGTTSLHSVKDRTVDLLGPWGCLFSKLDTSMSAASSEHLQFGSNIFCFCCCCPGTHGGHYFAHLRWSLSCGGRSVVPATSSCPAEIQAALGFEANSGRGCLGICFEVDRNMFVWSCKHLSDLLVKYHRYFCTCAYFVI